MTLRFKPLLMLLLVWPNLVWAEMAHNLMIENVQAPASLVPTARSAAVYFSIMNHGPEADRLVGLSTPIADAATLHETVVENDIAKMQELPVLDVPAGAMIDLKQGQSHVMLVGLKAPLKENDTFTLELVFEKAGKMPVVITVGPSVAASHDHGNMN
jgi:periplasmic copper chaperone A